MKVIDDSLPPEELPFESLDVKREEMLSFQQQALYMYFQCGSLAEVARQLKTTPYELSKLAKTEWWIKELEALQREEQAMTKARMTRILGKTLDEIENRLEFGEEVATQIGIQKKSVSASDLARVYAVVFDKRQLLMGLPTSIDAANEKLKMLEEKLRAAGQARLTLNQDGTEAS